MKNLNLIIIIICSIAFFYCNGGDKDPFKSKKQDIRVEMPSAEDTAELVNDGSVSLGGEDVLRIPPSVKEQEECDGNDNDKDGHYDEGCFKCCKGVPRGDFNCDNNLTMYDCQAPLNLAYAATIWDGDPKCADLTNDNQVDMNDVLACIDLVNEWNGR